jgi:hypothetical protein
MQDFPQRHIDLTQTRIYPFTARHTTHVLPYPLAAPRPLARALLTVALPLAKPTPLPFTPLLLNIGAFLLHISSALYAQKEKQKKVT